MKNLLNNSIKNVSLLITALLLMSSNAELPAKPTFKERVMEQAEAGKKVAVFTNLSAVGYTHIAPTANLCEMGEGVKRGPQGASTNHSYTGFFEDKSPDAYDMSSMIAEQLNTGMGTDAFVAVAQDEVADKTITALGVESVVKDWWNTDFTIVVQIYMGATYTTNTGTDAMKTNLVVAPLMYVNEVVDGKEALGFIVNGRALGSSNTDPVEHTECYSSLDELKTNIGKPDVLAEQAKTGISESLTKFIEKENAKYAKAMKKKKK